MKKIGILHGMENTFPAAFVERVNSKNIPGIMAEAVSIDKVLNGVPTDYAVIIDRISQDVPFYRAYLKNAALSGTAVINNPFWWSADEKFFNYALAAHLGVPVPNTALLPSKLMPPDTSAASFRNLKYPIDWEGIINYIGLPAYMKPHDGGGWKSVYRVNDLQDLFDKYSETEHLVMTLQSEVHFDDYFRCYYLGGDRVHIMPYAPKNPHHLRYQSDRPAPSAEMLATIHDYCLRLNHALGYDFNTVEFAVQDGIPYAIDFCNPAPDADLHSVGVENFEWIVENAANMAIERAQNNKPGEMNLTWGTFVSNGVQGKGTNADNANWVKVAAAPVEKAKATPATETAAKKKDEPKVKAAKVAATPDDLTKLEGIGPKIAEIINQSGITTYAELAKSTAAHLQDLLNAAGSRYKMHDPTTWPKQAALAAKGDWTKLQKLQDELKGGK